MARKNKAKKSQPLRDRTPVASRRVHNTRSQTARPSPVLTVDVRRAVDPKPNLSVKRKSTRTNYVDVKTSLKPLSPPPLKTAIAAKQVRATVRKPKQLTTQVPRHHSMLSLAPTPSPDVRKSSEKARDLPRCKKRPDSKKAARSKGGGGPKKDYVPWC